MPAFPAGAVVHIERKIVAAFRTAGAISPDRATTADALGIHQGLAFKILRRRDVLREVAGQRLYLDEPSWQALRSRHRRIAFLVLGTMTVLLGGMAIVLCSVLR